MPTDASPTTAGNLLRWCVVLALLGAPCVGCRDANPTSTDASGEANAAGETPGEGTAAKPDTKPSEEQAMPQPPGTVLRHAVFFKFKEASSEAQIQEVVDAFRALPQKIDAIIDFQWGVNNSPEKLNDGFTHCFLLTFKDDAGRKEYLPHPAHKAFGDVLRPHMEDVFVIDYWGTPSEAADNLDKPLMHAVFFKFKEAAKSEEIRAVEEAFAALPEKIDAIKAFEWGTNHSPETHDDGFTHCFMVTFDSEAGREAYLPHPDHQKFVELLKPVLDKPRVLDFWAAP